MADVKDTLFRFYLRNWFPPEFSATLSFQHQQNIFKSILNNILRTQLGNDTALNKVKSYEDFRRQIPITQYDFYEPYIEQIKQGKTHVMTTDTVKWLAKTAGTTSGKSKYIPITYRIMRHSHVSGSFFALSKIHQLSKSINIPGHKNLLIPGGIYETLPESGIVVGDISAILAINIPWIYRRYYAPTIETQINSNWEEKIKETAHQSINQDIATISGVPTWHLTALNMIRKEVPFNKLTDIWKNLQVFFHGGVSFEPYRKQFEELIGKEDFIFYEIYNATEGFFGIQETLKAGDLLLLTNNSIFFEFIPLDSFNAGKPEVVPLAEVQLNTPYTLAITAPNGLLRYLIGDVITFTGLNPFKFRITGRTQEYINAFGEDLLLANVENALMKANTIFKCTIREYTVAPYYIHLNEKGRMQVAIEFSKTPEQLAAYQEELDKLLKLENSNYAQKRNNDLALSPLEVISLPEGTFYKWMASKNKLGGQNKVPRLVNGRKVMEEILALR